MGRSQQHEDFVTRIDAHTGVVRKVAAMYARRAEDRRDLEQEIVAQLWKAFPGYDTARPFATWAYRIALNVAISTVRADAWRDGTDTLDAAEHVVGDDGAAPERNDALARLDALIAGLDPLHRALMLLYLEDLSYREIAEVLGISETNVATKINRVKHKLRTQLEP
jgi:RNA polymerase sigma-70 factor (ECF subfamily)